MAAMKQSRPWAAPNNCINRGLLRSSAAIIPSVIAMHEHKQYSRTLIKPPLQHYLRRHHVHIRMSHPLGFRTAAA